VKATPGFTLLAITFIAVAVAWFWALAPIATPLLYIHPNGWTDADLVRHIWHFRIIQPEWLSLAPQYDYLIWTQAETVARLIVLFLGWSGAGAAWLTQHHRRASAPPNQVVAANAGRAPRLQCRWPGIAYLR
jgi:hypothetical protein